MKEKLATGVGVAIVVFLLISLAGASKTLNSAAGLERSPVPPCIWTGSATFNGDPVASGTIIRARLENNTLLGTTATSGAEYGIVIAQVGGVPAEGAMVKFYVVVGDNEYLGATSTWNYGDLKLLNLIAPTTSGCENNPATAVGLASIYDKLVIVYCYRQGEGVAGWTAYSPEWVGTHPEWNTLTTLYWGGGYWANLTADCKLTYGSWNTEGNPLPTYDLKGGWNLFGWMGC